MIEAGVADVIDFNINTCQRIRVLHVYTMKRLNAVTHVFITQMEYYNDRGVWTFFSDIVWWIG